MKVALSILYALISNVVLSQTNFPALSPAGSISQEVGFTSITVDYERPAVRGRKIFGELVPYGEVWRTGAGKCTRISFDEAVVIDKKKIAAGTYSLFTVPGKDKWTIILNSDTSLYSAGRYDVAKDIVRFDVNPESSTRFYEAFTIDIDVVPNDAVIYLSWEKTSVHFMVDTGADQKTIAFIDETLMTGKSLKANEYAAAVEYYLYQGRDLDKALTLTGFAMARNSKQPWYYNLKIDVLEKQGNYADALVAAKKHVDLLEQHGNDFGWDEETLRVAIASAKSRVSQLTKMARG
jgi:tetratricopeptide (TPR) repeat protein